ncbi:MAG: collagenase [Rickettsiella sp.]|nr:collagenase [Rickettsiella sp.]
MQNSFVSQKVANFKKINLFLEKNKKKPRFHAEILQFYFYLQSFNAKNENDYRYVNPFAITGKSAENFVQLLTNVESFLFSNTAVLEAWKRLEKTNLNCSQHGNFTSLHNQKEAYRQSSDLNKQQALRLFESTKVHVSQKAHLEQGDFFIAFRESTSYVNAEKVKTVIIDPAVQRVKNTVETLKTVSINSVKQGWNTVWEGVNTPEIIMKNIGKIFNANTIPVSLLLAAGYPAAAMSFAQNNDKGKTPKKRSVIRSPYLKRIINAQSYKDWPQYHPYLNEIIKALEEELVLSRDRLAYPIKSKIFWFLRNYDKPYTHEQSKKIYQIVKKVLIEKDSELLALKENDLSILEDILILARTTFPDSEKDFTLFNLYINAAKNNKSLIYTKKAGTFITQLFDTCSTYFPESINSMAELLNLIEPIQSLIETHLVWNKNDPVAMLVQSLSFLKKIRTKYKFSAELTKYIDEYSKEISEKAITLIPVKFFDYPESLLKEDIGMAYVTGLKASERSLFKGLYAIRTPKDILPHSETQGIRGAGRSPDFTIELSYDRLSNARKVNAFQMAKETYFELKNLMISLGLTSVRKGPINIQIKLFNDSKHFERYGYMVFDVDSSGGGICIPGEGDTVGISFIYQTEEGFLNFKHEVTHALMMYFFGRNYSALVPGAFVEGIADFIDKGSVNANKMRALRVMLEKNEIKPLSEVVTLNEGGSIVYTWGYFWLKYMIEVGAQEKIAPIFSAIQKQNKAEITRIIDEYGRTEANHFEQWLVKLDQAYIAAVPTHLAAHAKYRQDLPKSQELLQFIKREKGLTFIFKNGTVFSMEQDKLFVYRKNADAKKIADDGDYYWFMEALAIDVIETKLKQLGARDKTVYQEIARYMLGRELDNYSDAYTEKQIVNIHTAKNISLRDDPEIASALEDFILRTNENLHWRLNHAYPRVDNLNHSSFEKILKLEIEERQERKHAEENAANLDNPVAEEPLKHDLNKKTTNTHAERINSFSVLPREVVALKNALYVKDKNKAAELISQIDFNRFYINTQFKGDNDNTLLHLAVLADDPHVVWTLVYKGASLGVKNAQGKLPYDLVTAKNEDNIAHFINDALHRRKEPKHTLDPQTSPINTFIKTTQPPLFVETTKSSLNEPISTVQPQINDVNNLPVIIGVSAAAFALVGLGLGYFFYRRSENHRKITTKLSARREQLVIQNVPMQVFSTGNSSALTQLNSVNEPLLQTENFERERLKKLDDENLALSSSDEDYVLSEQYIQSLPPPPEVFLNQRLSHTSDSTNSNKDSGRGSCLLETSIRSNTEKDMIFFRLTTVKAKLELLQTKLQEFPKRIRHLPAFPRMFADPLNTILNNLNAAMLSYDQLAEISLKSFVAEHDKNNNNSLKTIEHYLNLLETKENKIDSFQDELTVQINYIKFLTQKWSEVSSPVFFVIAGDEVAKEDSRILLTRKTMVLARNYFCKLERLTSYKGIELALDLDRITIALQALQAIFFQAALENITDQPFHEKPLQLKEQCKLCAANFSSATMQLKVLDSQILNIENKELRNNFYKIWEEFRKLCEQQNYFFTNRIDSINAEERGVKKGEQKTLEFIKKGAITHLPSASYQTVTSHETLEQTINNSKSNVTPISSNRYAFHTQSSCNASGKHPVQLDDFQRPKIG